MLTILENLFSSILGKIGTVGVFTWAAVYINQHYLNNFFSQEQIATAAAGAVAWLIAHGVIKGAAQSVSPEIATKLADSVPAHIAEQMGKSFPQPVVINAPPVPPSAASGG